MNKILNCITVGDIDGIGLELIFKIWNKNRKKTKAFFLLGDYSKINKKFNNYNYNYKLKKIKTPDEANKYFNNYLPILHIKSVNKTQNSLDSINKSFYFAKNKLVTSIITLPINKEKIISIKKTFMGHTEHYEKLDKTNSNMIFYHKDIIVSPLTTHISINNVTNYINTQNLKNKINSLINSLINDFNIKNPKIAISGLNPHAGENSKIGIEEKKIIIPIVKYFKQQKKSISGPFSGDSIFLKFNRKKYDCILTMLHDQALIPFKLLSFDKGVNFTSGLSFVRTSPCHGTAYDLVGKNKASEKSLYNAILLANKIYKYKKNDKKISRTKFSN